MTDFLKAGIHPDIPAEIYHADPCPEPSLSAGVAHRLITRSPLHAWTSHPRLNPNYKPQDASGGMDFGSVAHALLLQGTDICQIIEADDWRRQSARDERDQARATGLVPLLRKDWDRMCELVEAVKTQISRLDIAPLPLHDGQPEQTIVWQEDGVWCRARLDWLHDAFDVLDDLKTTGTTANPHIWGRSRLFADGKDVQCAFYLRGLRAITGVDAAWRFVVVEVDPPHGLSVISLAPSALELANRKVSRALELWKQCLQTDTWPGYPSEIAFVDAPAYEETRFLEAHWEEAGAAA